MPTHQIAGFIPKKLATDRYGRSFRQLTRDVALAMQAKDTTILGHFKLVLEDGEKIDGIDVTTDRIAELRDKGRNPMWFVKEDWMASTYGTRSIGAVDDTRQSATLDEVAEETSASRASDILALYERQVERLEQEVVYLRGEGAIKNDQIRDSHERQKETNVLMRDLHGLMNTMQQRLLPAPHQSPSSSSSQSINGEIVESDHEPSAPAATSPRAEKGNGRKRSGKSPNKKTSRSRTKRSRKQRSPSGFEKHTPTLHKAYSRIFHRS